MQFCQCGTADALTPVNAALVWRPEARVSPDGRASSFEPSWLTVDLEMVCRAIFYETWSLGRNSAAVWIGCLEFFTIVLAHQFLDFDLALAYR